MNKQTDFLNEETLLQHHGRKLGIIVDRSPKCHPEIAGEGIEYAWAVSKMHYRKQKLTKKKTKKISESWFDDAHRGRMF